MQQKNRAAGVGGAVLIAVTFLSLTPGRVAGQMCVGDCDGNGTIDIAELVRGVTIALGNRPLSDCPEFDRSGNGGVEINELVAAVSNAQCGCNLPCPTPPPTRTRTKTGTSTPTPTFTPTPTRTPRSDCIDISGRWYLTEHADIRCCMEGDCETFDEEGSDYVSMEQDGCNVSYLAPMNTRRSGAVQGDRVRMSGPFAIFAPGVTILENNVTIEGTATDTRLDLTGNGRARGRVSGIEVVCTGTSRVTGTR